MADTSGSDRIAFEEQPPGASTGIASVAVSGGLLTLGGTPTAPVIGLTAAALLSALARPKNTIWVGTLKGGSPTPNGSSVAPYAQISDALAAAAADSLTQVRIVVDPGRSYADFTVPAGLTVWLESGLCDGQHGASVGNVIVTGTNGGGFPVVFDGLKIDALTINGSDPNDQAVVVFRGTGQVGPITNSGIGTVQPIVVGGALIEPATLLTAVTFGGTIDVGNGYFVAYNSDVQQAVTCGLASFVDSRVSPSVSCSGPTVRIVEAEGDEAFPYGPPVITFTGAAGLVEMDPVSMQGFIRAGGAINNGEIECPDGLQRPRRATAAILAGAPVALSTAGYVDNASGTALADLYAFSGVAETAQASAGGLLLVAGNSSVAHSLSGLTLGASYWLADGAIIADADLATWIAGAASGAYYMRIGKAISTTEIEQCWGAPQVVP